MITREDVNNNLFENCFTEAEIWEVINKLEDLKEKDAPEGTETISVKLAWKIIVTFLDGDMKWAKRVAELNTLLGDKNNGKRKI